MRWIPTRHSHFWIRRMMFLTVLATATPTFAGPGLSPAYPGPLALAAARESVRVAADQQTASFADAWARVRRLAAGTEILMTTDAMGERERILVGSDDSSLTVLNAADPTLPAFARDELRRVASAHPDYLAAARVSGTVVLNGNLRLRPDGVFIGDRRVADFGRIVEQVERIRVAEIKTRRRGRGFWGHLGPLGGYFVGAMSGGLVAGYTCRALGRLDCDSTTAVGMLVGAIGGGAYGFHAASRETEEVVYLATQRATEERSDR